VNHHYRDIRTNIKKNPLWFDEHAVPRYCRFHPRHIADIYADECALVLIACQNCGYQFKVAISQDPMDVVKYMMMFGKDRMMFGKDSKMPTIADGIRDKSLHYGDPPNIECCPAGPTMNCEDIRILEYWKREKLEWVREKELEIDLEAP